MIRLLQHVALCWLLPSATCGWTQKSRLHDCLLWNWTRTRLTADRLFCSNFSLYFNFWTRVV